jgi:hypothetical protein
MKKTSKYSNKKQGKALQITKKELPLHSLKKKATHYGALVQ